MLRRSLTNSELHDRKSDIEKQLNNINLTTCSWFKKRYYDYLKKCLSRVDSVIQNPGFEGLVSYPIKNETTYLIALRGFEKKLLLGIFNKAFNRILQNKPIYTNDEIKQFELLETQVNVIFKENFNQSTNNLIQQS